MMSRADELLQALKENVNEWTCGYCNSGSNQPAAIFRELKKRGYKFKEISPNRWAKTTYCMHCSTERSHYMLMEPEPVYKSKPRISISKATRKHILSIFEHKDAFTGASISSTPEIDHKMPWTRMQEDVDANSLSDKDIIHHFQLLTREHNLLKDRACGKCIRENKRPAFMGINFWYKGGQDYEGSCEGCGWYDGKKWRDELDKKLQQ
jgi:hypothetical protein